MFGVYKMWLINVMQIYYVYFDLSTTILEKYTVIMHETLQLSALIEEVYSKLYTNAGTNSYNFFSFSINLFAHQLKREF